MYKTLGRNRVVVAAAMLLPRESRAIGSVFWVARHLHCGDRHRARPPLEEQPAPRAHKKCVFLHLPPTPQRVRESGADAPFRASITHAGAGTPHECRRPRFYQDGAKSALACSMTSA